MASTVKGLLKQISLGLFDESSASEVDKVIYLAYKEFGSEKLDVVLVYDNNRFNFITNLYRKEFGDIFKWISESLDNKLNFEIIKAYSSITYSGRGLLVIFDTNNDDFMFKGITVNKQKKSYARIED